MEFLIFNFENHYNLLKALVIHVILHLLFSRGSLFGYLASIGDKDVQQNAKEMFKRHIDGSKPLCAR